MNIILNGNEITAEELVRENARLIIQHEADQQTIQNLREHSRSAEEYAAVYAAYDKARLEASLVNGKLTKAIEDLYFVMAGGDPCKVCAKTCTMGDDNCKPVWRGETTEN